MVWLLSSNKDLILMISGGDVPLGIIEHHLVYIHIIYIYRLLYVLWIFTSYGWCPYYARSNSPGSKLVSIIVGYLLLIEGGVSMIEVCMFTGMYAHKHVYASLSFHNVAPKIYNY